MNIYDNGHIFGGLGNSEEHSSKSYLEIHLILQVSVCQDLRCYRMLQLVADPVSLTLAVYIEVGAR